MAVIEFEKWVRFWMGADPFSNDAFSSANEGFIVPKHVRRKITAIAAKQNNDSS